MYIFDTREKKNLHIKNYFYRHGIPYRVEALSVGDYMIDGGHVSGDRKQNLDELASNLLVRGDKGRFWREVRRAREQRIKLIVLCEHGGQIRTIRDVERWQSKYTRIDGKAVQREICRVSIAYGVEFLFCDKRSTPRRIIELLGGSV